MREWWGKWSTKSKIFIGGTVGAIVLAIVLTAVVFATGGFHLFS